MEKFYKYTKASSDRCRDCEYRQMVHAKGGCSFCGCFHEPYKGTWIAEIKDCPRKEAETVD